MLARKASTHCKVTHQWARVSHKKSILATFEDALKSSNG
jgi:hypothetical protein